MPLRLGLCVLLFATAACQPHLVPADVAMPLAAGAEVETGGPGTGDADALEVVVVENTGEEADASPAGFRDETPARIERLVSRTRLLGGARSAIRERRRR